jgi:hypothetical protein
MARMAEGDFNMVRSLLLRLYNTSIVHSPPYSTSSPFYDTYHSSHRFPLLLFISLYRSVICADDQGTRISISTK